MQWPREILSLFAKGLEIEPLGELTVEEVLEALCNETARRVVWRAEGDPANVSWALREPYTPLGCVFADGIEGRAATLRLHGPFWGEAVEAFYEFFEANAQAIFEAFQDQAEPYQDLVKEPNEI